MRRRLIVLVGGMLLGAGTLFATSPCSQPLLAQSGCCKERPSPSAPWRKRADLNFAQCRGLNDQRDRGDNIFEPAGFIWWDRGCS
jgi:hypothetical protein